MKTLKNLAGTLAVCLVVSACQAPMAVGPQRGLASLQTGAAAAGDSSDSGNSSDGSGNSSQDSGNSSKDSGNSSDNSKSDLNQSSKDSSNDSTDNSSDNSRQSTDDSSSSHGSKSSPVVSATVVALTAGGLGVVFWQVARHMMREVPPAVPPPEDTAQAAQTYLRSRAHQLREDLALGAGPTVEELAALARIRREHLGAFGRLLRTHRRELLVLADTQALTPERALAWLRRVGELARTDPRLEEDRSAFVAWYGGEVEAPAP